MMPAPTEEQIRIRAYEIWMAEGQPHGRDYDHWLMAVAELSLPAAPKPKKASAAKTDAVAAAERIEKKAKPAGKAGASKAGSAKAGSTKPAPAKSAPAKPASTKAPAVKASAAKAPAAKTADAKPAKDKPTAAKPEAAKPATVKTAKAATAPKAEEAPAAAEATPKPAAKGTA